jgi:hypothetical protein
MAYIPKNKIKTNLYSNGEYAYIDLSQPGQIGNGYLGEYYTLSTGKAFTGKYPGDGKNIPIITFINKCNSGNVYLNNTIDISVKGMAKKTLEKIIIDIVKRKIKNKK